MPRTPGMTQSRVSAASSLTSTRPDRSRRVAPRNSISGAGNAVFSDNVVLTEASGSVHNPKVLGNVNEEGLGGHASDHDDTPEIIMALDVGEKATMGCAFFDTVDGKFALAEDVPMADETVAEQFISHAQPTTMLVSGRAPDKILALLEKRADRGIHESASRLDLRVLPSSDFCYQTACEELVSLCDQLSHFSRHDARYESADGRAMHILRTMGCSSSVNLDSIASVNCAGVVLAELHRRRSIAILPDGESAEMVFHISSIEMFSLSDYLSINGDSLFSLQILDSGMPQSGRNRGCASNGGGMRESLSVYGLFHPLASTPQGRVRLKQFFLRPTLKMCEISERQRAITLFLLPENEGKAKQTSFILKKIRNIRPTIMQLRKGINSRFTERSFDRGVWATLRRFAVQSLRLRELASSVHGHQQSTIFRKLVEGIDAPILMCVGDMITRVVDFEQSKSPRHCSVKTGVNTQLDQLKRQYDGMSSLFQEVVSHVRRSVSDRVSSLIETCIFLPQLGFLIVMNEDLNSDQSCLNDETQVEDDWRRMFTDEGSVYYKNRHMTELDDQFGDIYSEIGDMEIETLHRLAGDILAYEETLMAISDRCGEFDAVLALAMGAQKYSWTAPVMTEEPILRIRGGRHPLQELVVPVFVPNDCWLGGEQLSTDGQSRQRPAVMAVTGPNHSGKSVYIKQQAIIVYLAHIGSFVPADEAIVGLTDKILTRISSRESISRIESAFAFDLRQISQAIAYSTERTLVVVDEFGKGTNADDGAGLFAAVLAHFLSDDTPRPRMVLATHFHEIFEGGHLRENTGLSLGHMVVQTDWEAVDTEEQVTYLFTVAEGHSSSSFGAQCARLNGVPQAVVDRASSVAHLLSMNEDIGAADPDCSGNEGEQLQVIEMVARRFLEIPLHSQSPSRQSSKEMLLDLLTVD